MQSSRFKGFTAGLLTGLLALALYSFAQAPLIGLQRTKGVIGPSYIELTAGAAVTAGQALYLDSNGKVQKLTSATTADFIGIAYNTAASAATVQVQISGVATATCDGNVTINDKVGGTGITPAGTLKTLASTLAVTSGAGTVTSGTVTLSGSGGDPSAAVLANLATTLTSTAVSGTGVVSRTAGRALTACTDTGTFSVLLFPS